MRTREVLRAARRRIQRGWTQGVLARNKYRHPVDIDSDSACKFCALGAIQKTKEDGSDYDCRMKAADKLRNVVGFIDEWNDIPGRTKEEVLDAFRRAAGDKK